MSVDLDGPGSSSQDSAIVAAVISMGRALGLHVVAEGVDYSRPLSARAAHDLAHTLAAPAPAPQAKRAG